MSAVLTEEVRAVRRVCSHPDHLGGHRGRQNQLSSWLCPLLWLWHPGSIPYTETANCCRVSPSYIGKQLLLPYPVLGKWLRLQQRQRQWILNKARSWNWQPFNNTKNTLYSCPFPRIFHLDSMTLVSTVKNSNLQNRSIGRVILSFRKTFHCFTKTII